MDEHPCPDCGAPTGYVRCLPCQANRGRVPDIIDLAERAATRRHPTGVYSDPERVAMAKLIAGRIFDASADGATASPLLHEEAMNLADAVVLLIEECREQAR